MADSELLIEREVARRVGVQTRQYNDKISGLQDIIDQQKNMLIQQNSVLQRLNGEPLCFGNLLKIHNFVNPDKFQSNDEIIVCDSTSEHYQKNGTIISGLNNDPVVDENGCVLVKLKDGEESIFSIGIEGKNPAQVRLTRKDDGTYAVVNIDGKDWEVKGIPDLDVNVGDSVKVLPDSKAIISKGYEFGNGPICRVSAITEHGIEIDHKGEKRLVYNPKNIQLEEGDRIACDRDMICITKLLERDARQRYKTTNDLNVSWDSIGGLEDAKSQLRDALELPFKKPELFSFYNVAPMRGILLYGPPGCGKTLLARVCAWSVANIHGSSALESGYIYVKSPEILDKWVGNTEAEIRELFERGRRHYRQHGYKGILVFDEADAIMPQRGTRRSSDVSDTIVPMFLGEMDGVNEQQTKENPIVILMSNRPDILDPAIVRPGRISKHIKVGRPNDMSAIDVLDIHTKKIPFADEKNRMSTLTLAVADMFSKTRILYRVNNEHDFCLCDAINGAMLENLAESAKMNALHRDIDSGSQTGLTINDFREAVKQIYNQQRGVNHSYDLQDFGERLGIQPQNINADRCFGAA